MNDEPDNNIIVVSHFINPHLFWYRHEVNTKDANICELLEVERKLQDLYRNKPVVEARWRPIVGDKVAVNFVPWNKFIRAEVLKIAEYKEKEFIVWITDYGFPLVTKPEFVRILPDALQHVPSQVRCGGIANIRPAEIEYDPVKSNLIMVEQDEWLQKACEMINKLLNDAVSVLFVERFQTENDHRWGDLMVVNHKGHRFNASDLLQKSKFAMKVEVEFPRACIKYTTTKIVPWLTNNGKTNMKYNTIKSNEVEHFNHLNSLMVKMDARLKVEDWCARNERREDSDFSELNIESVAEYNLNNKLDDITCDDSVSVNGMAKKNKSLNNNQNRQKQRQQFENEEQINYIGKAGALTKIKQKKYAAKNNWPPPAQLEDFEMETPENISLYRMKKPNVSVSGDCSPFSVLITKRIQKLGEQRKKALIEDEKQSKECANMVEESNSSLNPNTARAKKLVAMRRKIKHIWEVESNDSESNTTNTEANNSNSSLKMENIKKIKEQENHTANTDVLSFKLKPKSRTTDVIFSEPKEEFELPAMKSTNNNQVKQSQAGYDGLNLVPGGFDIARLNSYRDEENHWHRKKSTRNDHVPHDNSLCSEGSLSSTSKQSLLKRLKIKSKTTPMNVSVSSMDDASKEQPLELGSNGATLSSEISTSFISSSQVTELCRTTQLSTINQNLKQSEHLNIHPQNPRNSNGITQSMAKSCYNADTLSTEMSKLKSPTTPLSTIDQNLKQSENLNIDSQKTRDSDGIRESKPSINIRPQKPRDSGGITQSMAETCSNADTLSPQLPSLQPDKISNEKLHKKALKYTIEVKPIEEIPIIKGEIDMQTKFIDHLVLAHSSTPLIAIETVEEVPFQTQIYEEMRHNINKVYRIQVYSWTHLLRGNSLFVVNPPRTGKTLSYVPAICSLICNPRRNLRSPYGPIAIVLVASSRHVETVRSYSERLLRGFKADAPTCLASYGIRNFVGTKIELLKGCGMLIATPSSLLRLLEDNESNILFDWERLQHIVIDDLDLMLTRSREVFLNAIRIVFKMSKKSKHKTLQPQLIVTSRDWDGLITRMIPMCNQPLLLIGDFLEAAVYGRATLSVQLKASEEKYETIHRILKKQTQCLQGELACKRLLIMCNADEDVIGLVEFLNSYGYPCLAYYSRSTDSENVAVNEWKSNVSSQIFICTDDRLPELKLQNVKHLIHYSMPSSWTKFTKRFSALAQSYENFVQKNFEEINPTDDHQQSDNSMPPHSTILLDEQNSLQLPHLVEFMRKHNQDVHPDILAVSKRVVVKREESRISNGALLCSQLMEFGECDESRCYDRHELTRYDVIKENDDIPTSGELRIHILKVFSPTHYSARLIQHKPDNVQNWQEIRRSNEALAFNMQFDVHYRNKNNLVGHWPPMINDLCVYEHAGNFKRARILDAPLFEDKKTNVVQSKLKVKLRLIDDGTIISDVKCGKIFMCHDKFKDFPTQAVDIRLMHVVPFDNERLWDTKTTKQVQQWIMDDIKTNLVVQLRIDFALANTVFAKNITVMEELATLGTYRQYVNLKKSLIAKKFAMLYKGERKHIRDIAEEYGLIKMTMETTKDKYEEPHKVEQVGESSNAHEEVGQESSNESDGASKNNTMQSTENHEHTNGFKMETKNDVRGMDGPQLKTENKAVKTNTDEEEDWDNMSTDEERQRNEVYVPLEKTLTSLASDSPAVSLKCPSLTETPKEESWGKLLPNDMTKVEIGDEGENGNWENIFLQVIDRKHTQLFDDLTDLINIHVNHVKQNINEQKRNYEFMPLHNCIVKYNNLYLRAKVHGIFGVNVKQRLYRFFLCDYACFTNVKSKDLYNDYFYETTDEIVQYTPYQSIHCTLAGIQWDRFTKRYAVTKPYLYAYAVEERNEQEKKALNLYNLPLRSYKVLLFECENCGDFSTAVMVNKSLLENGITTTDEETKHYLNYKLDLEATDKVSEEQVQIEEISRASSTDDDEIYTFEKFLACLEEDVDNNFLEEAIKPVKEANEKEQSKMTNEKEQSKMANEKGQSKMANEKGQSTMANEKGQPKTATTKDTKPCNPKNSYESEKNDDEESHCTINSDKNKKLISRSSSTTSHRSLNKTEAMPPLKFLYKRPLTTWYETECVIFFSIYAPDIKDYVLRVKPKNVFFTTEIDNERFVLNLNLFGSVKPESVSHEIKGLNVVVRLVKGYFMKWPHLLEETTKYAWLKYNYSCFDATEMDTVAPNRRLQQVLEKSPHLNEEADSDEFDSEDSERDKFETYNRIEYMDDCFDHSLN